MEGVVAETGSCGAWWVMSTLLWAPCARNSLLRFSHLLLTAAEFGKRHFSFSSGMSGAEAAGLWCGAKAAPCRWHGAAGLSPGTRLCRSPAVRSQCRRVSLAQPCSTCSPVLLPPCDLGFWKPTSFMLIVAFPFSALKNYSQNLKSIEFSRAGKCRGFAWELGTCSAQMLLYFPLSTYLHLYICVFVIRPFAAKVKVYAFLHEKMLIILLWCCIYVMLVASGEACCDYSYVLV